MRPSPLSLHGSQHAHRAGQTPASASDRQVEVRTWSQQVRAGTSVQAGVRI